MNTELLRAHPRSNEQSVSDVSKREDASEWLRRLGARTKSARVRLGAAVLVSGALLAGCSGADASPAAQYADVPEAIRRGQSLFKGTCGAYCHGLKPDNRDAPYLFDCVWKNGGSDAEIFASISDGVVGTRMPGFGGARSEEDRWKLVAFLRSGANCP